MIVGLFLIITIVQAESFRNVLSCQQFSNNGVCCKGQNNTCVVKTSSGSCFCDEFCDSSQRTSPDCCPDYKQLCKQGKSTCTFKGVTYNAGNIFKKFCNKCKCHKEVDKDAQIVCDNQSCLANFEMLKTNKTTWTRNIKTTFENKTLNDGINYVGTIDPKEWIESVKKIILVSDYKNPPPVNFDPRFNDIRMISPIKNQGHCGTSWAISVVDVIADRLSLLMHDNVPLSSQQLIDCHDQGTHCNPGNPVDAWNYAKTERLISEDCYPWTGSNNNCQILNKQCKDKQYLSNKLYEIYNVIHLSSHHIDLMYEIFFKGSIQATMKVYQDFFFYNSGIYKCPKNNNIMEIGYHSVRIIGWGVSENNENYWIVANSWGQNWGENGYFKIAKGINECEIESYVLAAKIKKIQTNEIEKIKKGISSYFDKNNMNDLNNTDNNEYCTKLFEYKNCCDGFDGNCSVKYNNKFCYCNNFCSIEPGHTYGCCPDYNSHCRLTDSVSSILVISLDDSNVSKINQEQNVSNKIVLMTNETYILFMNLKTQIYSKNLPNEYKILDKHLPPISGKWRGDSWAVSATEVVSNRYSMKYKLLKSIVISSQQLISCIKDYQLLSVGQPQDAWIFMEQYDMVDETCYPWTGENNKCEFYIKENDLVRCQTSSILQRPQLYSIKNAYRIANNESDIMNEIINSGSVQATMKVYPDFLNYKNGIYYKPQYTSSIGYLSVRIIGWGEESNEKFWIVANSWGTDWGENGYFKIAKGINECEIENFIVGVEF